MRGRKIEKMEKAERTLEMWFSTVSSKQTGISK
jgi:hypothetical protein